MFIFRTRCNATNESVKVNKIALSSKDYKRVISGDKIHTLAKRWAKKMKIENIREMFERQKMYPANRVSFDPPR